MTRPSVLDIPAMRRAYMRDDADSEPAGDVLQLCAALEDARRERDEARFAAEAEKTERQQAVDLASREVAEAKRVSLQQLDRANAAKIESWRRQAAASALFSALVQAHGAMQTWFSSEYAEHEISRQIAAAIHTYADRVSTSDTCFCPPGYTGVCVACKVRQHDLYLEQSGVWRKRVQEVEAALEAERLRAATAEAAAAVRGGEWCAANRAEGRGGCGACAWCCQQAVQRAEAAEAELHRTAKMFVDSTAVEGCAVKRAEVAEAAQMSLRALLARLVQRLESHTGCHHGDDVSRGRVGLDARDKAALKDARAALETKP